MAPLSIKIQKEREQAFRRIVWAQAVAIGVITFVVAWIIAEIIDSHLGI